MSGKVEFLNSEQVSKEDTGKLLSLLESYFGTESDPEQMQITRQNAEWIGKNIPECSTIIKIDNEIVGSTFILPCTTDIREDFISGKINEAELGERVKKEVSYKNIDSIYLCSAFVVPEDRGKGLAFEGFARSIRKIIRRSNLKINCLFYWAYSIEGKKLAGKVARELGMKLYARRK